ncbi:BrnT family toxin [Oricola sp.]|uniref:BrnT family toxin n=1 Tax=Oricola sp. TaxID=1979950 RepID=UPI0025FDF516|nr:BrnT family toxin [Oricola sp.]MCI5073505.1 BrnT family toxin [Oricola sp.]
MIVWDERKRLANLAKHGYDFAELTEDFFLSAVVLPARDRRMKAIGRFEDGTIVVIYFTLGTEAVSLVSMRPASTREREFL